VRFYFDPSYTNDNIKVYMKKSPWQAPVFAFVVLLVLAMLKVNKQNDDIDASAQDIIDFGQKMADIAKQKIPPQQPSDVKPLAPNHSE